MAVASTTWTFECSPEQFYAIISDYETYPEFLTDVKRCDVLARDANRTLVELQVAVIKPFVFRMWITEEAPRRLSWTLDSGDLLKASSGSWDLADDGGRTRARYSLRASFKVFVPEPVTTALIQVNLPRMM